MAVDVEMSGQGRYHCRTLYLYQLSTSLGIFAGFTGTQLFFCCIVLEIDFCKGENKYYTGNAIDTEHVRCGGNIPAKPDHQRNWRSNIIHMYYSIAVYILV